MLSEPRQRRPQELSRASGRLRNWLNAVASKEYIERLQMVIRQLHKCDAEYLEAVPVHEVFQGKTVWQGEVEVFSVSNHPRAKRAYAWSENQGQPDEKFTAVLEIPPVRTPLDRCGLQSSRNQERKTSYAYSRRNTQILEAVLRG